METLGEIIAKYKQDAYACLRLELGMYSIEDVEGLVGGYIPKIRYNGKIFRLWCRRGIKKADVRPEDLVKPYEGPSQHQWWMNEATKRKIAQKLTEGSVLGRQYRDFEELYDALVGLKITDGNLFRYDLALRIGYCLGILPSRFVYLHAGAQKGAEALQDKGLVALPQPWKCRVEKAVFVGVFPDMDSIDIENALCVHHANFARL